jgi:hypothetical protein
VYQCKVRFRLDTKPVILLKYDPNQPVVPDACLALDETERIELVMQYHRRERIQLPNERLHATTHVIVENQVALGDALPVGSVLTRLRGEGLDRHEAIHAIGWILSEQLFSALQQKGDVFDLNAQYLEKLSRLTPESRRKQTP